MGVRENFVWVKLSKAVQVYRQYRAKNRIVYEQLSLLNTVFREVCFWARVKRTWGVEYVSLMYIKGLGGTDVRQINGPPHSCRGIHAREV
jgi:hypothetical protein